MTDAWAYSFKLELEDNDTVALGNGGAGGNGGNFNGTFNIDTGNTIHVAAGYGEAQEAMYSPPSSSFELHLQDNDTVALGNGGDGGNGGNFNGTFNIDTGNDIQFG